MSRPPTSATRWSPGVARADLDLKLRILVEGQAPSRIILAVVRDERAAPVDATLEALELAGRRLAFTSLSAAAA